MFLKVKDAYEQYFGFYSLFLDPHLSTDETLLRMDADLKDASSQIVSRLFSFHYHRTLLLLDAKRFDEFDLELKKLLEALPHDADLLTLELFGRVRRCFDLQRMEGDPLELLQILGAMRDEQRYSMESLSPVLIYDPIVYFENLAYLQLGILSEIRSHWTKPSAGSLNLLSSPSRSVGVQSVVDIEYSIKTILTGDPSMRVRHLIGLLESGQGLRWQVYESLADLHPEPAVRERMRILANRLKRSRIDFVRYSEKD
jgi:hypothetical protein